jgi:hypothetical protein
MLIRVMYRNRTYDMVKDFFLENLIGKGRIERFCRSDGWVEIGRDPVRGSNPPTRAYSGPERREPVVHRSLETLIRIGRRHYQPFFSGKFEPD